MKQLLLGVLIGVVGCASQKNVASPGNHGEADMFVDISASALPHARAPIPPRDTSPPENIRADEKIPGLSIGSWGPNANFPVLQGAAVPPPEVISDQESMDRRRRQKDPEGAATGYCVQLSHFSETAPRLLSYVTALTSDRALLAERFEGAATHPGLHILTGWVSDEGMRRVEERTIPLRLIGSMAGVEVYAFIDDAPPPEPPPPPPSEPKFKIVKGKKVEVPTAPPGLPPMFPMPIRTKRTGPEVNIVVRRPALVRGNILDASFHGEFSDGTSDLALCRHARIALPLERGNGSSARFDVGVETAKGARLLRVNVSTMWLAKEDDARISARIGWSTSERDTISITGSVESSSVRDESDIVFDE